MWKLNRFQYGTGRAGVVVILALLVVGLAACSATAVGDIASTLASSPGGANSSINTSTLGYNSVFTPSLAIDPPNVHGGLYVQVRGAQWPQNMLVLIALEDAQGRSEILAANDTDQTGNLATGFLYPIDERWLQPASRWVVAATADGSVEERLEISIVAPGEHIAEDSSPATTQGRTSQDEDEVELDGEFVVILPFAAADLDEGGEDGAAGAEERQADSLGIVIDMAPVQCRTGQEWIRFAFLGSADFDARSVNPNSVSIANGPSNGRAWGQNPVYEPVANPSRTLAQFVWRWHMEDVNRDGHSDLVMQFRLNSTDVTCDATSVTVRGQTRDGQDFAVTVPVNIRTVEQG